MITPAERAYIYEHAYVPEHLPHYVTAISRTEPFLVGDFITHMVGTELVFVGYPLREEFEEFRLLDALAEAKTVFQPEAIFLIAPSLPEALIDCTPTATDAYYRIDIENLAIPQKIRNMLSRARQEVFIVPGKFGREHKRLIDDFLRTRQLDDASRFIFQRIGDYAKWNTALLFEARNARGDLVAFDIAEFGAQRYAFYMFNIRSQKRNIPGVSDLLLAEIIEYAITAGKRYINLGLGINPGIEFFKKKWRAIPFLHYITGVQESKRKGSQVNMFDLFSQL